MPLRPAGVSVSVVLVGSAECPANAGDDVALSRLVEFVQPAVKIKTEKRLRQSQPGGKRTVSIVNALFEYSR
ncbi:MAG: hypothetical protein AcusKO_42560 [Acuticoccus sp.]